MMQAIAAERLTPTSLLAEFMQLKERRVSQSRKSARQNRTCVVPGRAARKSRQQRNAGPATYLNAGLTLSSIAEREEKKQAKLVRRSESAMPKGRRFDIRVSGDNDFIGIEDAIRKLADEIQDFTTKSMLAISPADEHRMAHSAQRCVGPDAAVRLLRRFDSAEPRSIKFSTSLSSSAAG